MTYETILLVDDESLIRSLVGRLLHRVGYEVFLAKDGWDGIEVYRENSDKIDLVILDLVMPGLPGVQVLEELRAIKSDVRVVISSGRGDAAEEVGDLGVAGFLAKPFDAEELRTELTRALLTGDP